MGVTTHASARVKPAPELSDAQSTCLLTAEQLAERWQVPKTQIYRLARTGRVPVVRIGRYCRFRVESVKAWERECELIVRADRADV